MSHRFARTAALVLSLAVAMPAIAKDGAPAADPVVASVDGTEIHMSDIEEARTLLPQEYRQLPLQMVYEPLVLALIDIKVSAAAAKKQGLADSEEVKRVLVRTQDQVLQQALIRKEIDKVLTDEALRARYAELASGTQGQEQIKARHILVKTKVEAETVIKDLKSGGDFAKLARERSQDSSSTTGGDLGYFSREEMVPPFSEAAFSTPVGSYTDNPVETQFGWHVILVEDKRADAVEPFEAVRDQLRDEMTRDVVAKTMEGLRSQASIKRFNIDGSPM